jgi:hypothetical protein
MDERPVLMRCLDLIWWKLWSERLEAAGAKVAQTGSLLCRRLATCIAGCSDPEKKGT